MSAEREWPRREVAPRDLSIASMDAAESIFDQAEDLYDEVRDLDLFLALGTIDSLLEELAALRSLLTTMKEI